MPPSPAALTADATRLHLQVGMLDVVKVSLPPKAICKLQ